mmetsp:Transcript_74275/g.187124  ORF Transcript_74275/g.187124 Transcript_74275/m.187124 type:complete len:198 (-) Transcript_74275:19-612(-)
MTRWPLALVTCALLVLGALANLDGSGLCANGECINCLYCNGDCYSHCTCYSEINTCCCKSPPGHYAVGYEQVACPGGTYQDRLGKPACKPCSDSSEAYYYLQYRGSIDHLDCEAAKCETVCGDNTTCQEEKCMTGPAVVAMMESSPKELTFCSSFDTPIPATACSWTKSGAGRALDHRAAVVIGFGVALASIVVHRL